MTNFWETMLLVTLKGQEIEQIFCFEKLRSGLDPVPDPKTEPNKSLRGSTTLLAGTLSDPMVRLTDTTIDHPLVIT